MTSPAMDKEPTVGSMVETLLDLKTGLQKAWYKAGDGVVYVEKVALHDGNDTLRLVYTEDSPPTSESTYSHLVISKDGTVIASLDTDQGINDCNFQSSRRPGSELTYGPSGDQASSSEPASVDPQSLLKQIPTGDSAEYEQNVISLIRAWANSSPPVFGTRQPFCTDSDWPSTSTGRQELMNIGTSAAERIITEATASKLGTAANFLRMATDNLRASVLTNAQEGGISGVADLKAVATRITELADSLKDLGISALKPEAEARLVKFINSKLVTRTEQLMARLEDIQELLQAGGEALAGGTLPEGRRERAAKQSILDRAVPQVRYLTASSLATFREEWNGIPVNLGGHHDESALQLEIFHEIEMHFARRDDTTFLIEWEGDWTPHGVVVNNSPIVAMQNQMVGLDEHGYNGVDYERIVQDGGESGDRQMILLFVPNGTADSVTVDTDISNAKNLDRMDRVWLG